MSFQNSGLLLAGCALIAVPLLIHLLNRRRIRIVDWAAMDFLLEAHQRNRRRVLFENLLLLLLRCLAVGLLALVIGRPLLTSALAGRLGDAAPLERIVLLDDSLSMQATNGTSTLFDAARDRLIELCRGWAAEAGSGLLTVRLTSRPEDPVVQSGHLSSDRVEELVDALRRIEPTDLPAELTEALAAIERDLDGAPVAPRQLIVVTDLRQRDWQAGSDDSATAAARLAQLARRMRGALVLDAGSADDGNVAITAIQPEGILAADVPSRINVTVSNLGRVPARDLEVRFTAGEAVPLVATLDHLAPGESTTLPFAVTFPRSLLGEDSPDVTVAVQAELASQQPGIDDRLTGDNTAYLAAHVCRGIPVLIVDGDPSAEYGRSESFYLARALAPPGTVPSGIAPEVVSLGQFNSRPLDAYQVVVLCNVGAVDEAQRDGLATWVRKGGGLVFFPGDECQEGAYNACWYGDGSGLSPVRLAGIRGDEAERAWVTFRVEPAASSFLALLAGDDNPLLQRVKVFRWWDASVAAGEGGPTVDARWTDPENTPAIVSKTSGLGRVTWFGGPADADWSNWSSDPSYVVVMQELVRMLAGSQSPHRRLQVGQDLRIPVELAEFRPEATLRSPDGQRWPLVAVPLSTTDAGGPEPDQAAGPSPSAATRVADGAPTVWQFVHPATHRHGLYELQLTGVDGRDAQIVIAANINPDESNLRRADANEIRRQVGDAPVVFLEGNAPALERLGGESAEIWWYLAWILAALLGLEPLLAWQIGRSRQ